MNIESHINSGSLKSLRSVLKKWQKLIHDYIKYCYYEDNPWWYNERAGLSILAAAVWCTNGIALEEYVTEKNEESERKKGRCDLYIGLNSRQFNCEAKHTFCDLTYDIGEAVGKVEDKLKEAIKDAKKLDKDEFDRMAICIAVPCLEKTYDDIDESLKKWCIAISDLENCDAFVTAFPLKARKTMLFENYFYPGVAILFKKIED